MEKYIVDNIKINDFGANVVLTRKNGGVHKQHFPVNFVAGMHNGDIVRGLGKNDYIIPPAWVYRGRLHLTVKPVSEYRIKNFISDKFGFGDGMYFRYALARALIGRGIKPTFSDANNLRLFLYTDKVR